jgi:choline kinase
VIIIKAIILAAGIGSRLGKNLPKAMVKVDKKTTILDSQLDNLKKIVNVEDINIVVGFKKDLIEENYPYLSFVYNKDYSKTNTSKSLLLALYEVKDYDILWLNGDVVFESKILKLIQNTSENIVCVNNTEVSGEEVKYTVDNEGYIKNISKSVENGLGEAVGINFIKKEDVNQLISCLIACEKTDYFEKGIEFAIEKGVKFIPIDIKDKFCTEVDFEEDLKKARNFVEKDVLK